MVTIFGIPKMAVEVDGGGEGGDEKYKQLFRRLSLDNESRKSPTSLPWDRFQNWLHCVCVVTFDLELGQAMEVSPAVQCFFLDFWFVYKTNPMTLTSQMTAGNWTERPG